MKDELEITKFGFSSDRKLRYSILLQSLEFSDFQVKSTGILGLRSRPTLQSNRARELAVTREARLSDRKLVFRCLKIYALKNTANQFTFCKKKFWMLEKPSVWSYISCYKKYNNSENRFQFRIFIVATFFNFFNFTHLL